MTDSEKYANEYIEMMRGTPKDRRLAFIAGYKKAVEIIINSSKNKSLDTKIGEK